MSQIRDQLFTSFFDFSLTDYFNLLIYFLPPIFQCWTKNLFIWSKLFIFVCKMFLNWFFLFLWIRSSHQLVYDNVMGWIFAISYQKSAQILGTTALSPAKCSSPSRGKSYAYPGKYIYPSDINELNYKSTLISEVNFVRSGVIRLRTSLYAAGWRNVPCHASPPIFARCCNNYRTARRRRPYK